MGAIIEASATARPSTWARRRGSVRLAVAAGHRALRRAGRAPAEIELLVHTGIYVDELIAEPANAAFIQRRLGANPDPSPDARRWTFSFDLNNGASGLLTGLQVVDGFIASGTVGLGLVVTADADPWGGASDAFPFSALGGAVLLAAGAADEGFTAFRFDTYPEYADLFEGRGVWEARRRGLLRRKRGLLLPRFQEKAEYRERCTQCAERSVREFLDEQGVEPSTVDLCLSSQHPVGFPRLFGERCGLGGRVVEVGNSGGAVPHTAAAVAALERARGSGALERARTLLFLTVGSGITVGLALYRSPGRT
jgi:3-oxoacyl-[acyl-carrier-protein] synthase III